jgi:hypothetical protein
MKKYTGYDLLLGGLFMALALVFPIIFHAIGLGSAFLPMFFPILAAGFLIALPAAMVVGVVSPLVSALLTGMPPFFPPMVFIMMAEGLALTLVPALLYRRLKINAWISAATAMLVDRLVLLAAILLISRLLELPEGALTAASLLKGLPGTILLPLVIPPLVKKMETTIRLVRMTE